MVTASIKKYITLCFSVHSRVLELLVHCQNLPETEHTRSVCAAWAVSDRLGITLWGTKASPPNQGGERGKCGFPPRRALYLFKEFVWYVWISKWSPAPCRVLMTQFKSLPCAGSALLPHHSKHRLLMPRAWERLRKAKGVLKPELES